jgi:hypothetical protein
MKDKKIFFALALFFALCPFIYSAPLYSPSWGFSVDVPEGYEYVEGDERDRFSFENSQGARFDLIVYYGKPPAAAPFTSLMALVSNVQGRLSNTGNFDFFEYGQKNACLMELLFSMPGRGQMSGWALFFELIARDGPEGLPQQPMLLAMAYGPAAREDLRALHLSALDSIAPSEEDRLTPGPVTEFLNPRLNRVKAPVFGFNLDAWIFEEDAEAAQALVDREFEVLRLFEHAQNWQEAWIRFYRAIYRDSFGRLIDIAFQLERHLNVPPLEKRDLADQMLKWVQSFEYERDFFFSDFVNVVSAATEGRGDCDSRAMLWAVIVRQAGIQSAIMVSRHYGHAMGLADLEGTGARFALNDQRFLVAETTAKVDIGLIGETVSHIDYWLAVPFE